MDEIIDEVDNFVKSIKWTTSSQEDEKLVHRVNEFIIKVHKADKCIVNVHKVDDFAKSIKWTASS